MPWCRLVVAIVLIGSRGGCVSSHRPLVPDLSSKPWTFVEGGVTRGDTSRKQLALVFTGGDFGEGAQHILDVLVRRGVKASFFVTGDFIRKPDLVPHLKRMVAEGHYLGPHSDAHALYAPWDDRTRTLVSEAFFKNDLQTNIDDLRALGALRDRGRPVYFIPPYEWYNAEQARWSRDMGVLLFNFTPGSGSNRDWAPEGHRSFAPSRQILDDILEYERKDPRGLNGFILLLHLGSERSDKMHVLLEPLVEQIQKRGYAFVRIDELLKVE
jgi:peptidoglycan/xylan/chitin deacetylase (PgdA/CDA1 family)